jgi:hypothetical protein
VGSYNRSLFRDGADYSSVFIRKAAPPVAAIKDDLP